MTRPFELFLFSTDETAVAAAVARGVSGVVVDWERVGKRHRQAGADTQIGTPFPCREAQISFAHPAKLSGPFPLVHGAGCQKSRWQQVPESVDASARSGLSAFLESPSSTFLTIPDSHPSLPRKTASSIGGWCSCRWTGLRGRTPHRATHESWSPTIRIFLCSPDRWAADSRNSPAARNRNAAVFARQTPASSRLFSAG